MDTPSDCIEDHLPAMRRLALHLTRDRVAADDLVQDTVLRALEKVHRYESGTNMQAWLATLMRNIFLSQRRRDGLAVRHARQVAMQERRSEAPARQDAHIYIGQMWSAMHRMKDHERNLLSAIALEGMELEQLSQRHGLPTGTIKSRAARARAKLRLALGEQAATAGRAKRPQAASGVPGGIE
nr:sigma-70 family RNA polymerase sigma factor [Caenispirillum salinarum]